MGAWNGPPLLSADYLHPQEKLPAAAVRSEAGLKDQWRRNEAAGGYCVDGIHLQKGALRGEQLSGHGQLWVCLKISEQKMEWCAPPVDVEARPEVLMWRSTG